MREQGRKLLFLIGRMHRAGYGGLRFMPMIENGIWKALIGPRLLFSKLDGAFVPMDLRHRCISVSETDDTSLFEGLDYEVLESLFCRPSQVEVSNFPGGLLGEPDENLILARNSASKDAFKRFMDQCWLKDSEYQSWFLVLCGRIAIDHRVAPIRKPEEASKPDRVPFQIASANLAGDPYSSVECWPSPPPGKAASSGPWEEKSADIATAQPRPKDLPDLVWPHGNNRYSDSALDNWYDDNAR